MGRRVTAQLAFVVAGGDHLASVDHDRTDGDVLVIERPRRLAQRETHEVLVAGRGSARATVDVSVVMSVPFVRGNFGYVR